MEESVFKVSLQLIRNFKLLLLQAWILLMSSPVDKCTFCITVSFKAEGHTESALIHRRVTSSNIQA